MDNIFDGLKITTFDVIALNMGYDAIWNGVTARVLFNDPSEEEEVGDYEYEPQRPSLEFKEGDWPGLKDLIEDKSNPVIETRGKQYYALKIIGAGKIAQDGETYKVTLQEV